MKSGYKHITQPNDEAFQVRIVKNKKEYSRYFCCNLWGSKKKALDAAVNWRDQRIVSLGRTKPNFVDKITSNTGVRGVSRTIFYDKRVGMSYLNFSVHWRHNKKAHTKKFCVGNVENITAADEYYALQTAILFRQKYEHSRINGKTFNPDNFKLWKTKKTQ